jgi:redox-sensitive bicupin YhaK (pirin superfamily)
MMKIRKADARGRTTLDWLDSRHTFSFADYFDPALMGYRALRVINEDRVVPAGGFPTHGHRDMEIISYVISGALEHKDNLGNSSVINAGQIQRMSAGTGVRHSEYNASRGEPVHFLQIWIAPARANEPPGYEQTSLPLAKRRNELILAAAPAGENGAVTLRQDARIYAARIDAGKTVRHGAGPGRGVWVQIVKGDVALGGAQLKAGDGAAIEEEAEITIEAVSEAEVLVFDLG